MSIVLYFVLALIVQAVALKFALASVGLKGADNKMSTALGVATLLNVAMLVTAFIPVVGWIVKPLVWLLIIMAVYNTGFFKTVAVWAVQIVIQWALKALLGLIGFPVSFGAG